MKRSYPEHWQVLLGQYLTNALVYCKMSSRELKLLLSALLRANNIPIPQYLDEIRQVPPKSPRTLERAVLYSSKIEEVNFFEQIECRTM